MIFRAMMASIGICALRRYRTRADGLLAGRSSDAWIYGFSAACLVVLLNPFISLWLGADYLRLPCPSCR